VLPEEEPTGNGVVAEGESDGDRTSQQGDVAGLDEPSSEPERAEGFEDVPFDSYERELPEADLDGLERDLELVAAEVAEDAIGTPLPEPVEGWESQEPSEEHSEEADPEAEPEAERTGVRAGTVVSTTAVVFASIAFLLAGLAFLQSSEEEWGADGGRADGAVGGADPAKARTEDGAASDVLSPAERAIREAKRRVRSAHGPGARARRHLEDGRFRTARRLTVRAMAERGLEPELREIFDRSIRRDESLRLKTQTIGEEFDVDAIHALGGGWSVTFRMTGDEQFAFKPAQKHWERGWRGEIAAYHLCEMVACQFEIPRNRPVRIRRSRFERLYSRVDNEDQRAYREKFEKLEWVEDEGPDGRTHEYLYGTLKNWVPEFVKWPIEYQNLWEPWLSNEYPRSRLEQPLEEVLQPLRDRGPANFYGEILEQRGDATTRSVARGLSSILTFDYLTTNWDRFSTAENFYGVNNQFADGRFISIDNGAAFSRHRFDSVERRLLPVTRYSESMVTSIRALRPEVVDPVLFPDPNSEERERLDIFWEQRDRFLDRINALVAEYGAEAVYEFQ